MGEGRGGGRGRSGDDGVGSFILRKEYFCARDIVLWGFRFSEASTRRVQVKRREGWEGGGRG